MSADAMMALGFLLAAAAVLYLVYSGAGGGDCAVKTDTEVILSPSVAGGYEGTLRIENPCDISAVVVLSSSSCELDPDTAVVPAHGFVAVDVRCPRLTGLISVRWELEDGRAGVATAIARP